MGETMKGLLAQLAGKYKLLAKLYIEDADRLAKEGLLIEADRYTDLSVRYMSIADELELILKSEE